MSKVPQHLIEEARKRGIVPGARIQCASVDYKCHGTVAETEHWFGGSEHALWVGKDDKQKELCGYSISNERWATVITPAPQAAAEGLVEGDSVECGSAMQAAIIELAKELGVSIAKTYAESSRYPIIVWYTDKIDRCTAGHRPQTIHTPEAFIAKLRATAAQPKPIKIGYDTVKFNSDRSITVGCTTVSFATIEEVYNRLKKS